MITQAYTKIALILVLLFLVGCMPQNKVCFETNCFDVELAITQEQKSTGLMYRTSLQEDKGMLFIFDEESEYPFWMKDTLIPLDMIWINSNKEVVRIVTAQPCEDTCLSINPNKNAQYVLELNAGTANKIGLEIGDKLVFHNIFK
jgi:uncharacterized membrane protein (UPF0127 family)